MSHGKAISIREQTFLDSLKRALRQSAADKIRIALKLSNLCYKLFKATSKNKK